jgi:sugar transferase (PEP-CTERM/EpsH1 system associated)
MHVIDQLSLAGMEYGVIKLVNRIDPERIQSMIVSLRHHSEEARRLLPATIPVFEMRKTEGRNWRLIGRLASLLRDRRVDIVHSHNWSTLLYAVAAARLAKIPAVVHGEHGKNDTLVNRPRRVASRLLALGLTRACAVSRDLAEELVRDWRVPRERVAWIPNGVDLDVFEKTAALDDLRREFGLTSDHRVLMNTGGFRPVKDHPTLLRAFAIVHRARPEARLLLVGSGGVADPRAGLDRMAADLGIGDAVRFAGVRRDIPGLLELCEVYVSSSRYEGMSNTILEAMAATRPVVATAVGGTPDLVEDGVSGFLVPAGAEEPMAARVTQLLDDATLRRRMGEAGRARIEARHSMTEMVRAYSDLYETMWAERGGRSTDEPDSRAAVPVPAR